MFIHELLGSYYLIEDVGMDWENFNCSLEAMVADVMGWS